jgi:hypothetical protein
MGALSWVESLADLPVVTEALHLLDWQIASSAAKPSPSHFAERAAIMLSLNQVPIAEAYDLNRSGAGEVEGLYGYGTMIRGSYGVIIKLCDWRSSAAFVGIVE